MYNKVILVDVLLRLHEININRNVCHRALNALVKILFKYTIIIVCPVRSEGNWRRQCHYNNTFNIVRGSCVYIVLDPYVYTNNNVIYRCADHVPPTVCTG